MRVVLVALALSLPLLFAPVAQSATWVVRLTTDAGIPCDVGAAGPDVTDQINAVIAAVPEDATVILECLYKIDHAVWVKGKRNFRFARLVTKPRAEVGFIRYDQTNTELSKRDPRYAYWFPYVQVSNSSRLYLADFTIRGPLAEATYDASRERAHAFSIQAGATDVIVKFVDVTGVHGDVVRIGALPSEAAPVQISFSWITSRFNGRQMIALIAGQGLFFRNLTLRDGARSGIDHEPGPPLMGYPACGVANVLVENSTFQDMKNYGLGLHPNTSCDWVIRRSSFVGGLGINLVYDAVNYPQPHTNILLEDVGIDGGGVTVAKAVNFVVRRGSWRLTVPRVSILVGTGSVERLEAISTKAIPPVCLSGLIDLGGNVGVGTCP